MESEAGRLHLHLSASPGSPSVFPAVSPRERLQTLSYEELSTRLCSLVSYRCAADILNRMLHRSQGTDGICLRTLADSVDREGARIRDFQERFAEKALKEHGFDPVSCLPQAALPSEYVRPAVQDMPEEKVAKAIERCNATRTGQERVDAARLPGRLEDPAETAYISIDDIGVTRQKESRKPGSGRETKYVENTVVHVAHGSGRYILAGVGMEGMFRLLIAFLLSNGLMKGPNLVFFTDGASNIRSSLERLFPYRPYTVILDWYHLEKKCREYLSSALKGKDIRNQVSGELLKYLWAGNTEYAADYLLHLGDDIVRNREWLQKLIQYLDKNYSYIPCYALRKELGLRNSSNPVEKANDVAVAQRQKHNGMSWSKHGSSALSHIRAIYLNGEADTWFREKRLGFQLSADEEECA